LQQEDANVLRDLFVAICDADGAAVTSGEPREIDNDGEKTYLLLRRNRRVRK
jgi:hypothetical protein